MAIHPNSDGSQTEGTKLEAWGKFVSHQLGLACTAVTQLTVPAGCNQAVVQADGAGAVPVRFTLDGSTPTTALGFLIPAGQSITLNAVEAAAAKFIGATVNAVYTL
jgi:hypothetical protein